MCFTFGVEARVMPIFPKFGIFDNSGGAVPCMCCPKWNLRWNSDSWDTFRKMMYHLVRPHIPLREEVMRRYSQKVVNIDGFIIYMTSPRGPPPVGLQKMGRTPWSWTPYKPIALPRSGYKGACRMIALFKLIKEHSKLFVWFWSFK